MSKALDGIKNLWKKANEAKGTGQFDDLDDGRYLTIITNADVGESQGSGRLQIMLEFTVQEGEFEKKKKRNYIGLDTEIGVQIAVNTLNRLGIEVEDPSDLEDKLKSAIGKVCKIQLKTKSGKAGDFQNVYILKVMGQEMSEEAASNGPAAAVAEPDIEDAASAPAKPAKVKKEKPAPEPEVEPEPIPEAIPEEVELKVGMTVVFPLGKKEVEGKVEKIEEDKGTALIRYDKELYRIAGDKISIK